MRKAKELDNILDECLERLLVRGDNIEQCLQSYPEYADELKPLLDTIVSAREVTDIRPRPEFRASARYQFRLALQEAKTKKGHRFFGWQPVWVTVVAVVLTIVLAGGTTVAAAGNSMPDEPLYPVKVFTEQLQVAVTRSPISKAELYANLADRRVTEIVYLANKGDPEAIESTAQRLNTSLLQVAALSRLAGEVSGKGGEAPAKPEITIEQAPAEPGLQMAPLPSPQVAPAPSPGERAPVKLAPEPPPSSAESSEQAPEEPSAKVKRPEKEAELKAVIDRYAKSHPDALRAALESAPPSAQPALRRAIEITETRYQEATQALEERKGNTGDRGTTRPKGSPR